MNDKNAQMVISNQLIAEYNMLRDEMLLNIKREETYRTLAFSSIATGCGLAERFHFGYAIIISMVVAILLQSRVLSTRRNVAMIGAYLCVFLEPRLAIKWETRNIVLWDSVLWPATPSERAAKPLIPSHLRHMSWPFNHVLGTSIYAYLMSREDLLCTSRWLLYLPMLFCCLLTIISIWQTLKFSKFSKMRKEHIKRYKMIKAKLEIIQSSLAPAQPPRDESAFLV